MNLHTQKGISILGYPIREQVAAASRMRNNGNVTLKQPLAIMESKIPCAVLTLEDGRITVYENTKAVAEALGLSEVGISNALVDPRQPVVRSPKVGRVQFSSDVRNPKFRPVQVTRLNNAVIARNPLSGEVRNYPTIEACAEAFSTTRRNVIAWVDSGKVRRNGFLFTFKDETC